MSATKFRRAYSLRMPSQKPGAFMDSRCYDRLDEGDCQDERQGQNETSGNKENGFSWEIPLITEAPKLHYCRRKWSSKSLRLPKTRQADEVSGCPPPEVTHVDHNSQDFHDECDTSIPNAEREPSTQSQQEEENEGEKQKCKKMKHYKKTIDRAFRRGWDTFIANIYTISLTRTSQDSPYLVKAC